MPIIKKEQKLDKRGRRPGSIASMPSGLMNPLDTDINTVLPLGKVNYSNLDDTARIYRAVVTLSKGVKGAFTNIQEAINYVNNKYGSGSIFIKKGTYTLSYNITLYSNIYLVGEDNVKTVIEGNAGQNQIILSGINNAGIERIRIQDCYNAKGAVYITNSNTITLRKIAFLSNTPANGTGVDIYIDNANGTVNLLEISFNTSNNSGSFVKLIGNGVQSWFIENQIVSPKQYVFYASPTQGGQGYFISNYFQDTVYPCVYGFYFNSKFAQNLSYFTSQTSGSYQFIFTNLSNDVSLNENFCYAGGNGGLMLTNPNDFQVTGNRFNGNGGTTNGLQIGSATDSQFVGNRFISSQTTAGSIGTAYNLSFSGNEFLSASGIGLLLDATGSCGFSGNVIVGSGAGNDGIKLQNTSSENAFSGNFVKAGSTGSAFPINISDANSQKNCFVGNRLNYGTIGTASSNQGGTSNIITSNS